MGREFKAKSFKSGNSVAIRMPAALGVEPEREWTVEERDGDLVLRAIDQPKRKFNITKVKGCAKGSGLRYVTPDERLFVLRPSEQEKGESGVQPG